MPTQIDTGSGIVEVQLVTTSFNTLAFWNGVGVPYATITVNLVPYEVWGTLELGAGNIWHHSGRECVLVCDGEASSSVRLSINNLVTQSANNHVGLATETEEMANKHHLLSLLRLALSKQKDLTSVDVYDQQIQDIFGILYP